MHIPAPAPLKIFGLSILHVFSFCNGEVRNRTSFSPTPSSIVFVPTEKWRGVTRFAHSHASHAQLVITTPSIQTEMYFPDVYWRRAIHNWHIEVARGVAKVDVGYLGLRPRGYSRL